MGQRDEGGEPLELSEEARDLSFGPSGEDIASYEQSLGIVIPEGIRPKEQLEHVCFSDTEEEELKWLWHKHVLLGKSNNLVGHPGDGKTFIMVDAAARVSTGRAWPDGSGKAPQGNVLMLSAEDGYRDTILPRLRAHGADLDRVYWIKGKKGSLGRQSKILALDVDHHLLEDKILELDAILTILDPTLSFTGKTINANAEVEVREFLGPLAELAERTGTALWGSMHYNKKQDLKTIQRVIGAMAWIGVPRSTMCVAERLNEPGTFDFAALKLNVARKPSILSYHIEDAYPGSDIGKLVWHDELVDPYEPGTETTVPSELERAIALMEKLLPEYGDNVPGYPTAELEVQAKVEGISESTLERARSKRGVEAQKVGDAWYVWLPPTGHKPPSKMDLLLHQPISLSDYGEGDEGDDALEALEGVE